MVTAAEGGMHAGGAMVDTEPSIDDGQVCSFPSTPARRRGSPPAMGPPSAGGAPKTPFRDAHAPRGTDASSPSRPCPSYDAQGHHHMHHRRKVSRSFSIQHSLMQRESRGMRMGVPRSLLQDFVSSSTSTYQIGENSMEGSPPFSMRWGQTKREGTLAVADEEGHITLINSRIPKAERTNPYHWPCHRNAIFDIAMADGDDLIASASGDQTIRVWDLSRTHPVLKATLRGHGGSVKSVQFRPGSQNELVSGAREGSILFWDVRAPEGQTSSAPTQNISPSHMIHHAHVREDQRGAGGGSGSKARKSAGTQHSVTSVVFIDDTVVATAGANDGVVKLWDLRKSLSLKAGSGGQIKSFLSREASATGRARGISSLAVNASRSKLLASSADHHIYIFDCIVPEVEPTMLSGHVHNGFYVKSSFSPDGRYIVSGSSDECVYIWDVSTPLLPPIKLRGHRGEVSDVRWCPTDMCKLASSSDDTTVRVWSIDRERRERMREVAVQGSTTSWQEGWAVGGGCEAPRDAEDVGEAEVPESWSQPSLRSEDDLLACNETMFVSNTTNHTASVGAGTSTSHANSSPASSSSSSSSAAAASNAMARGPAASPSQWFNAVPEGGSDGEPGGHRPAAASPPVMGGLPTSPGPAGGRAQGEGEGSVSPSLKQAKLDEIWKPRSGSPREAGRAEVEQMAGALKQTRIEEMFRPRAVAASVEASVEERAVVARLVMNEGDEAGGEGGSSGAVGEGDGGSSSGSGGGVCGQGGGSRGMKRKAHLVMGGNS